jgi:Ca2+-binding RTX toxin-like protein
MMNAHTLYRMITVGLAALMLGSIMSAMAEANAIPTSGAGEFSRSITANDLKPPQCSGIHLTNLIVATGMISGTSGNDLILGGPGADTISGEGGNDCIVGGGGNDTLFGDSGTDVCIGGSGNDILDDSCETKR